MGQLDSEQLLGAVVSEGELTPSSALLQELYHVLTVKIPGKSLLALAQGEKE